MSVWIGGFYTHGDFIKKKLLWERRDVMLNAYPFVVKRIEFRNGLYTLEHVEEIGFGKVELLTFKNSCDRISINKKGVVACSACPGFRQDVF